MLKGYRKWIVVALVGLTLILSGLLFGVGDTAKYVGYAALGLLAIVLLPLALYGVYAVFARVAPEVKNLWPKKKEHGGHDDHSGHGDDHGAHPKSWWDSLGDQVAKVGGRFMFWTGVLTVFVLMGRSCEDNADAVIQQAPQPSAEAPASRPNREDPSERAPARSERPFPRTYVPSSCASSQEDARVIRIEPDAASPWFRPAPLTHINRANFSDSSHRQYCTNDRCYGPGETLPIDERWYIRNTSGQDELTMTCWLVPRES